jgi:CMP-N,N'-diacetyllegionaminic acid synthase
MKILGLIPARGGSKGIPRKNIKLLNGKPLLLHTIDEAKKSILSQDIILSSEDEEIIALARKKGLPVPFVRPTELSQDDTPSIEVIRHALNFFIDEGIYFDAVCLLQVTNPFRSASLINQAAEKFITADVDSLVSVSPIPHNYNPNWAYYLDKNKMNLNRVLDHEPLISRRQDLKNSYYRDGAIYITKSEVILKQNSIYGNNIGYVLSNNLERINIDTEEDWFIAESVLKNSSRNQ